MVRMQRRRTSVSFLGAALDVCKEQQCLDCPMTVSGLGMLPSLHSGVPGSNAYLRSSNMGLRLGYISNSLIGLKTDF